MLVCLLCVRACVRIGVGVLHNSSFQLAIANFLIILGGYHQPLIVSIIPPT